MARIEGKGSPWKKGTLSPAFYSAVNKELSPNPFTGQQDRDVLSLLPSSMFSSHPAPPHSSPVTETIVSPFCRRRREPMKHETEIFKCFQRLYVFTRRSNKKICCSMSFTEKGGSRSRGTLPLTNRPCPKIKHSPRNNSWDHRRALKFRKTSRPS